MLFLWVRKSSRISARGRDDEKRKGAPDQLPSEPQERLLEVVVRLSRNFEVLEILFAMEGNRSGLHFPFL